MSRLGKMPIEISNNTEIKIQDGIVIVKGPKGELSQKTHPLAQINIKDKEDKTGKELVVSIKDEKDKKSRAMWGLYRQLINNMVKGVNEGFEKKLEINGVGYKANIAGNTITLNVGYSHPVEYKLPEGITAVIEKNVITINGIDKQVVGEVSAQIRKVRKPEPYKGKGIKYIDEVIRRKVGKTAASAK